MKPSLQFACNFAVINASEVSQFLEIFKGIIASYNGARGQYIYIYLLKYSWEKE
jgi:hypothetical protein